MVLAKAVPSATVTMAPTVTVILIIPIGFDESAMTPTVTIVPVVPMPSIEMTVAAKSAAMAPSMAASMPTG